MSDDPRSVEFQFQPLVNLTTKGVVGLEAVGGSDAVTDVRDVLWSARDAAQVVRLDVDLAVRAVRQASAQETLLPLHINVTADTVMADPSALALLYSTLRQFGRRPNEVMLEIRPCFGLLDRDRMLSGIDHCRQRGYQVAFDGVGTEEYPLTLLVDGAPDLIKIDAVVVSQLSSDRRGVTVLESIARLARGIGARLGAEGVTDQDQLAVLRQYDVTVAQGELFGASRRHPTTALRTIAGWDALVPESTTPPPQPEPEPRLRDYAHPPLALPMSATADEVRVALRDQPTVSGAVLLADDGTPGCTLDRSRFLFTVSGTFGHALHAHRSASRLGDPPRTLSIDAGPRDAVELMRGSDPERILDDIVLLDADGRCVGVARAADILRGVTEMKAEQSASLHPRTRFPGAAGLAAMLDRKLADNELFVVSRLEIGDLADIEDGDFTTADDTVEAFGRILRRATAAAPTAWIAHLSGDAFVVVTDLADVMSFGHDVLERWGHGPIRQPPLSISSVVSVHSRTTGRPDLFRALSEIRREVRSVPATRWMIGWIGSDRVDLVRDDSPTSWPVLEDLAG